MDRDDDLANAGPGAVLDIGLGFMRSQVLLSAVELRLFTFLDGRACSAEELRESLGLHSRSVRDFLDALLVMGLLERDGDGANARYRNAPSASQFLDEEKPSSVAGMLHMANARLYGFWGGLTSSLQSGLPRSEGRDDADFFRTLYADESRLAQFLDAMRGMQIGNFIGLAERFPFASVATVCDVGGASGALAVEIARRHPAVTCTTFDLPAVEPLATRYIARAGMADRVQARSGDFMSDELPEAEVIVMANILHDFDESTKRMLIEKAFRALPENGVFIAVEMVIDDERRANLMGLLMSLNMSLVTPGGFDYTFSQFGQWAAAAGFARTRTFPLGGPTSAIAAYKC